MGIVSKEMIEESAKIELKVVDQKIYKNAKACIEAHIAVTGKKPKMTAMDSVRLVAFIESQQIKKES